MRANWDLETKEDWRAWVASEPLLEPPARWTRADYDGASEEARARYDADRADHHGAFGPIVHERAEHILQAMMRQLSVNRNAARKPLVALALDGHSMLGKTTLLNMLGWLYERKYPAIAPGVDVDSHNDLCPVVNLSLEADANVVSINESILRFLGAPLPPRGRQRDLNQPVKSAVEAAAVRVVFIDELSFLKSRYVKHQVVNDHLKWLMNQLGVTLVFAGVDSARQAALVAGKQTSWRLKVHRLHPFSQADSEGKREWQQLLSAIEDQFVLLDAPPRMLSGSKATRDYLHRRSQGYIGPLLDLLRNAAEEATSCGHECIDIELMDRLEVVHGAAEAAEAAEDTSGHGAQTATAPRRRRARATSRGSTAAAAQSSPATAGVAS